MAIGIPMVIIVLPLAAFITAWAFKPEISDIGDVDDIRRELRELGPLTTPERKVLAIQTIMLVFWILSSWVPQFDVVSVGVLGATAMFLPGIRLFTWQEAQRATSWEILLMAGAVATLGVASSTSGLAQWLVDVSLGVACRITATGTLGDVDVVCGPSSWVSGMTTVSVLVDLTGATYGLFASMTRSPGCNSISGDSLGWASVSASTVSAAL